MKKTSVSVGWGWGLQREHDASFFFTPVLLFLLASHFSSLSAHVRVLAARDWYQPHVHDRRRLPAASRRQPLPLRQPGEPDEREAHDPEILGCVRLSYSFTRWLERAERRRLFQREIEGCEDGFTRTSRTSFFLSSLLLFCLGWHWKTWWWTSRGRAIPRLLHRKFPGM